MAWLCQGGHTNESTHLFCPSCGCPKRKQSKPPKKLSSFSTAGCVSAALDAVPRPFKKRAFTKKATAVTSNHDFPMKSVYLAKLTKRPTLSSSTSSSSSSSLSSSSSSSSNSTLPKNSSKKKLPPSKKRPRVSSHVNESLSGSYGIDESEDDNKEDELNLEESSDEDIKEVEETRKTKKIKKTKKTKKTKRYLPVETFAFRI